MKVNEITLKAFNTCRINHPSESFTRKEIFELLTNEVKGLDRNDYIITLLVKHGILSKSYASNDRRTRLYKFTDSPIHVAVLTQCMSEMENAVRKWNKTKLNKTTQIRSSEVEIGRSPVSEEFCVKFLKDRGYRIYKPEYKEI